MSKNRSHHGMTLLELLLVLALLVIIGAIAAPSLGRFMKTQRLRDSATLIRGEFARARVQAMKTGRVHVFRYEQDGRNYTVDFWMADDDLLEASDTSFAVEDTDVPVDAKQLPEGVRFFLGETEADGRSARVEAQLTTESTTTSGTGWSAPILFYSDGTTSSADIILANEHDDGIRVSLRGLTGIATVSEVTSLNAEDDSR